jgi:hypothetical protein
MKPKVHFCVQKNLPLPLPWAIWIQSTHSYPISVTSVLISLSYLRLGLSNGLPLSGVPSKTLYAFQIISMPCPPHPPWFDHANNIWRELRNMKLVIGYLVAPSLPALWVQSIPSTLLPNTLYLWLLLCTLDLVLSCLNYNFSDTGCFRHQI